MILSTDSTFGQRLRELRERAGLSQSALAEKAGLKEVSVYRLEVGDREPAWGTVLKLARALGVNTGAFDPEVPLPVPPPRPMGKRK